MTVLIPTLTTERLILRAPEARDFEAFADFRTSERARWVGGPFSRAAAFVSFCAAIGHWQVRGYGRWIVTLKEDDAPLGLVGLNLPDDWPEPELAWSLFSGAEGRGIAAEAALAARAHAYEALGWTTAISVIDAGNTRSAALAQRLGARRDGVLDHPEHGPLDIWRHPAPEGIAA